MESLGAELDLKEQIKVNVGKKERLM